MSEQPPRPDSPDAAGLPPPAPPVSDALAEADCDILLAGQVPPSDDTPTIISKSPPKTQANLFSGILRGRKLAHFELIEPIGVGGMAAVLRARDTQLERFVALKILPPEMSADPENVARFHQEARAAARLDHETIARVFFCGQDQNLHFIAFEFVEGDNLRTVIDRRGPLPVPEALHYMLQIATGLAHAASRGVVHRDIKPSNIIISSNGRAKLVDMGLARNLGPHSDEGLTQSGVTLGTFDYISPEQALEPRDADVRSDIYSLGCTFYHALTGQAPVPEGTAAKKLHHHQHVPPIDPRQINPDIPDEVAAILGRMMAKDPRQRYQRPEHLVQHLLQATHRLAPGSEAPEGVLFVDAALPAPPRARPLLVAGCAAAIVVVLVLLIGRSQDGRSLGGSGTPPPPRQTEDLVKGQPPGAGQAGGLTPEGGGPKVNPPVPETDTEVLLEGPASKLRDFALVTAKAPDKKYRITLTKDLGPSGEPENEPIVLHGQSIILSGGELAQVRPTVWCRYVGRPLLEPAGLVIDAEEVRLQNLRFVADAGTNGPAPGDWATAVLVKTRGQVEVKDCEFLQGNVQAGSLFNSVALQARGPGPPSVTFKNCCFLGGKDVRRSEGERGWLTEVGKTGGQTAVAVRGAMSVKATDCAFGPHAALFRFFEGPPDRKLTLMQCTALAGDEWTLAALEDTSVAISASDSFFGRVSPTPDAMAMMNERKPLACLARLSGTKATLGAGYRGISNRYLKLDAVRASGSDETGLGPETFTNQLLDPTIIAQGTDEKVLPGDTRPWKTADPIALLQGTLTREDLRSAFSLDFARVPDLRYGEHLASVVGLQSSPWGLMRYTPLPPVSAAVARKVVDPKVETDTAKGVYKSLEEALTKPKSGDVIEIRGNADLPVGPLPILKNGVTVTIRPARDCRPVLVLDNDTHDKQAALFRVDGGQLNLEELEFRLAAPSVQGQGFDSVAVALLFGDGGVHFTSCRITLDGQQVPLAAVTLADPTKGVMMQPGTGGVPKVIFDTCFIRGSGDLVSAKASRLFDLEVNDSLAALDGSLLDVDAGTSAKEATVPPGKVIEVRLNQVTAYLSRHLVRLRAANVNSLLPVHCNSVKSLFVSASDRHKALLHVAAGPADSSDSARARLPWQADGNNYFNFSTMIDQQADERNDPRDAVSAKWKEMDSGSHSDEVKFTGNLWPDVDVAPAAVSPSDFEVKSGPRDCGIHKPLPAPAGDR